MELPLTGFGKIVSGSTLKLFIILFFVEVAGGERSGGEDQEHGLGHAKFGMCVRYPSGNVK